MTNTISLNSLVHRYNPRTQLSSCRCTQQEENPPSVLCTCCHAQTHLCPRNCFLSSINVSSSIHELPSLALMHTAQTKALFAALQGHRHQVSHRGWVKSCFFNAGVQTFRPHTCPQDTCGSWQPRPDVFDTEMGSMSVSARASCKNSIRRRK